MERSTRQRSAIRAVIDAAGRPLSSQEILDGARVDAMGLGIATVYRNVKQLLAEGAIAAVNLPGESPRYETAQSASHHHHHFSCTQCGRVFDVAGCHTQLDKMVPAGFVVQRHELTLYGVCAECGAAS